MLIMKSQCERCRAELPVDAEATICSFECTFCPACAADLDGVCPNCSGELATRPRRDPSASVVDGLATRLRTEVSNIAAPRQLPHVTVSRTIAAPAREIFDVLASPVAQAEIDGSGTLTGRPDGPDRLYLGARFGMGMNQQGVRYRSLNEVVEFTDNVVICWQTFGEVRGRRFIGGQRWRYELSPVDGGTLVAATYDWSEAKAARFSIEAMGFPAKARTSLADTLDRLAARVEQHAEV